MSGAKRSATSDLNHDNWDQEEDKEEAGVFRLAPPEEINRRVIKRAVRRKPAFTDSNDTAPENQKNAFRGLGLKSSGVPEAEPLSLLDKVPKETPIAASEGQDTNSVDVPKMSKNPFASFTFGKNTFTMGTVPSFDFLQSDKNKVSKEAPLVIQENVGIEKKSSNSFGNLPIQTTLGSGTVQSSDVLRAEKVNEAPITEIQNNTIENSKTTILQDICPESKTPSISLNPNDPGNDEDKVPKQAQFVTQKNEGVEKMSRNSIANLPCVTASPGIWCDDIDSETSISTKQSTASTNSSTPAFEQFRPESNTYSFSLHLRTPGNGQGEELTRGSVEVVREPGDDISHDHPITRSFSSSYCSGDYLEPKFENPWLLATPSLARKKIPGFNGSGRSEEFLALFDIEKKGVLNEDQLIVLEGQEQVLNEVVVLDDSSR